MSKLYTRRSYLRIAAKVGTVSAAWPLISACSALAPGGSPQPVSSPQAGVVTLRYANSAPAAHSTSMGMVEFKRVAEERSGGRIKVDLFHGGVLGTIVDMVQQVQIGALSLTMPSPSFLTNFLPQMAVLTLPYLITRTEHAFALLDGPVGQRLGKALESVGLKHLGYYDSSFRSVFNNVRPINTPADLKGIKIRLQQNPAHFVAFEAFGANPVALDINEVYQALQTRLVDAFEGNIPDALARKFDEVVRFHSLTMHAYESLVPVMSLAQFNGLAPDLQRVVLEAGEAHVALERKVEAAERAAGPDLWTKKGKPLNQLSPEAIKQFRDLAVPTWKKVESIIGSDLLKQATDTVQKLN